MKKSLRVLVLALVCMVSGGLLSACWFSNGDDQISNTTNTTAKTYTVTFDSCGGSTISAKKVKSGYKVDEPVDPTRYGYIFVGWYADADYIEKFNFDTALVTENITLYAKWTENIAQLYTWTLSNDGKSYEIEKYNGNSRKVEIPAVYNDKPVTAIKANAFENCTDVLTVIVPDSVTSIGTNAFKDCTKLLFAAIPDSVTTTGESLFENCPNLVNIYLVAPTVPTDWPSNWKGDINFPEGGADAQVSNGCVIAGLYVYQSDDVNNGYRLLGYLGEATQLTLPQTYNNKTVTTIGYGAFGWNVTLRSVTIPSGYLEIGELAFYGCEQLTSVSIAGSVLQIDNSAFSECEKLTSVYLTNGLVSIGYAAFNECSSLKSITIPSTVTTLGDWAFHECSSLKSITIPSSVTKLGKGAFSDSGLTAVAIMGNVTDFGDQDSDDYYGVFQYCENLSSVALYNLTSIPNRMFRACTALKSITIPSTVTSIERYAFANSGLTSINLPNTITTIGEAAFWSSGLTSIIIPNSVTTIDRYVFLNCISLQSVTLEEACQIKTISERAFDACSSLTEIRIPSSVTKIDHQAFANCVKLEGVTFAVSGWDDAPMIARNAFDNTSMKNEFLSNMPESKWFD